MTREHHHPGAESSNSPAGQLEPRSQPEAFLTTPSLSSIQIRLSPDRQRSERLIAATIRRLQETQGNGAVQRLTRPHPGGTVGLLQRDGATGSGPMLPQVVLDAVEIVARLAPKQTAAELRQTRLDVNAVADGAAYQLPFHAVTMDTQTRTRLQEAVRQWAMERIA